MASQTLLLTYVLFVFLVVAHTLEEIACDIFSFTTPWGQQVGRSRYLLAATGLSALNLGTLALYAAAAHGCHVHAFEIQPDVECRLRMSARRNAATRHRVVVHRSAVHSTPVLKMTFPATGANPGGAVQVESSPPCVA